MFIKYVKYPINMCITSQPKIPRYHTWFKYPLHLVQTLILQFWNRLYDYLKH